MSRLAGAGGRHRNNVPRASGDEPDGEVERAGDCACSPRERG